MFPGLMNNSIYGKTLQNRRNEKDVRIVTKWAGRYGMEALISKPNNSSCTILDENVVIVQMSQTFVTLDRPIYVGLAVLDISKIVMYKFHYNFITKSVLHNNLNLLCMDTDLFIHKNKKSRHL